MPTGITPNGDGLNDFFVIHGIEAFPDNTFTVFNRWGNVVYQKDGYANEWNGINSNGDALPDATYFVILEITNGEVLKGYVDVRTK
jgi:gliding motility-associated-like protein